MANEFNWLRNCLSNGGSQGTNPETGPDPPISVACPAILCAKYQLSMTCGFLQPTLLLSNAKSKFRKISANLGSKKSKVFSLAGNSTKLGVMTMCNDETLWYELLRKTEKEFGFEHGFRPLFVPWRSLLGKDVAFLTPLPGTNVPKGTEKRSVAEEYGNTLINDLKRREKNNEKQIPINRQFKRLSEFIHRDPKDILTGVAYPFRATGWNQLNDEQQEISRFLGKLFWTGPLLQPSMKLIITSGTEASNLVRQILPPNQREELCIDSEWGNTTLCRYTASYGKTVISLPYLGQCQLFSRTECDRPLREIFDGFLRRSWK